MSITLVLGGARSGKSLHAERLVMAQAPEWIYVATGQAHDDEMGDRIAQHRARRGAGWVTVDAPLELAAALARPEYACRPVLVDCLTLWTSNLMFAERNVAVACDALEASLAARKGDTIFVSNEVGLGIVPENALARRFCDEAGRVNQRIAAVADSVIFMVAGLPMTVK